MTTLWLRFLGPLDIHCDGQELSRPPALKSQSLPAYLVLHCDRPQPRERLAGMFWGDTAARRARRSLSTALWHTPRRLPGEMLIVSDSPTVQFDPQADLRVDGHAFEMRASLDDMASLQSVVALQRGAFMDGFAMTGSSASSSGWRACLSRRWCGRWSVMRQGGSTKRVGGRAK